MSDDRLIEILLVALAVALVAALAFSVVGHKRQWPVRFANLAISGGVVIYWVPSVGDLFSGMYVEVVPLFVAFELAVLIATLLAIVGVPVPGFIIWTGFAAHGLFIALALLFVFTFQMKMM